MPLDEYRLLGRSGLAVSPLALGTMTFGTARWGADEAGSRAIFDSYVEAGGNFVDTADVYAGGLSETMLGDFIAVRSLRHRLVLATKAGFATGSGPHAGGNGSKHLHDAVEGSLRRLRTDHVDLYWLHVWDGVTPAEAVVETMANLMRAGKIRHWGISNAPAWYVARVGALAGAGTAPVAMQHFHALVNRDIDDEHLPLAQASGMGMMAWSPLAYGFLTGKYQRAAVEAAPARAGGLPNAAASAAGAGDGHRLDGANPFGDTLFTDRNWAILDTLRQVAAEAGHSPAAMALAWVVGRPGISATLIGASRASQVVHNIAALDVILAPAHRAALDAVSAPVPRMLYELFKPELRRQAIFGGSVVRPAG